MNKHFQALLAALAVDYSTGISLDYDNYDDEWIVRVDAYGLRGGFRSKRGVHGHGVWFDTALTYNAPMDSPLLLMTPPKTRKQVAAILSFIPWLLTPEGVNFASTYRRITSYQELHRFNRKHGNLIKSHLANIIGAL